MSDNRNNPQVFATALGGGVYDYSAIDVLPDVAITQQFIIFRITDPYDIDLPFWDNTVILDPVTDWTVDTGAEEITITSPGAYTWYVMRKTEIVDKLVTWQPGSARIAAQEHNKADNQCLYTTGEILEMMNTFFLPRAAASQLGGGGTLTLTGAVTGSGNISSPVATTLATQNANTLLGNNTGSSASPVAIAIGLNSLIGRGSSGNIQALTLGSGLYFTGPILDVGNLPTTAITSGVFSPALLGSGVADNTKYLRGDGTWQVLPTGGASDTDDIEDLSAYGNLMLTTTLDDIYTNKSDVGHTHAQSDITGLTAALAGKSDTSHTHSLTLSGNVTGSGTVGGTIVTTIGSNQVGYSQMQDMSANTVLCRPSGSAGDPTELTIQTNSIMGRGSGTLVSLSLSPGLSISGSTLTRDTWGTSVTIDFGSSFSQLATATVTGLTWVTTAAKLAVSPVTSGTNAIEIAILSFQPVISDIVDGVGFTLTVFCAAKAKGQYTFNVIRS